MSQYATEEPSSSFPLDRISSLSIIEEYDNFEFSNVAERLVGDYFLFKGWEISIIV